MSIPAAVATIATADRLYAEAFDRPRSPRSGAYRAGVREALRYRVTGRSQRCPFAAGTPEADAYYAGCAEGHAIWADEVTAALTG